MGSKEPLMRSKQPSFLIFRTSRRPASTLSSARPRSAPRRLTRGGMMRNVAKRIFTGNTTSLFLSFILLSFALFFIIGVYTVFVLISVQLVALIFSDKIVYRIGSVRPDAERPLVTIVSVRSNPETLKSISQHGKKILSQIREEITRGATD